MGGGRRCVVPWCGEHADKRSDSTFHSFPKKLDRAGAWRSALGLSGVPCPSALFVCSRHFELNDFVNQPGASLRRLKDTAVPRTSEAACSVQGCWNTKLPDSPFVFYEFPYPMEFRRKWAEFCGRPGFVPTKSSILCSAHFSKKNFKNDALKPSAVPDVAAIAIVDVAMEEDLSCRQLDNPPSVAEECEVVAFDTSVSHKRREPSSPRKIQLRKKVKMLQAKVRRKNIALRNTKDLLKALKNEVKNSAKLIQSIRKNFDGLPLDAILTKSPGKPHFTKRMKEFAQTLYYYSPKAYKFVKKHFRLPGPSTLRRWISSFNCEPGFLNEVFLFLKEKAAANDYFRDFGLVVDGMSIRKQILFDKSQGKFVGYAEVGGVKTGSCETLASEALVFMIVGLKTNFKCAVAYFFINKIRAVHLANIVKTCITKLHESGLRVHTCTFDGLSTNLSAMRILGCNFPSKPNFRIPNVPFEILAFFDNSHVAKLARNAFADVVLLKSGKSIIDYRYITKLHSLQEEKNLKLANKLSDKHIFFRNRKMNVRISVQTLSNSVANAIDFLRFMGNPDFLGSEGTVEFIKVIDSLFDVFNSRVPFANGLKGSINDKNWADIWEKMKKWFNYLNSLSAEGVPILCHPRKTFALGYMSNINAMQMLVPRLLNECNFKFILTYKFSQDHLELLFSCIRSHGGFNNNPNVLQFKWALRKMMFRNSVRASDGANVLQLNENIGNNENSDQEASDGQEDDIDVLCHLLEDEKDVIHDNILYYIGGFVARSLIKKLEYCEHCQSCLTSETGCDYSKFLDFVNMGRLLRPSDDTMKIIRFVHKLVKLSRGKDFKEKKTVHITVRKFVGNVFKEHAKNYENHELNLIRLVSKMMVKIVAFHFSRNETNKAQKGAMGLRQKLTKIVLFNNV